MKELSTYYVCKPGADTAIAAHLRKDGYLENMRGAPFFNSARLKELGLFEEAQKSDGTPLFADPRFADAILKPGPNLCEYHVYTRNEYMSLRAEREGINFICESRPHRADLSKEVLTRPAPNSGIYTTTSRIPEALWLEMKASQMCYHLDAEMLEDFDMFSSDPGWRYRGEALDLAIRRGFKVKVHGREIKSVSEIPALLDEMDAEAERQRREREEAKRAERAAYEEACRQYDAALETMLKGLVTTDAWPTQDIEWTPLDLTCPYPAGTTWYKGEVDGHTVFRSHPGTNTQFHAPRAIADQWIRAGHREKMGEPSYARIILLDYYDDKYRTYHSDDRRRLVDLVGLETIVEKACETPWIILESDLKKELALKVAQMHNIPFFVMRRREYDGYECSAIDKLMGWAKPAEHGKMPGDTDGPKTHYILEGEGRMAVQTYDGERFLVPSFTEEAIAEKREEAYRERKEFEAWLKEDAARKARAAMVNPVRVAKELRIPDVSEVLERTGLQAREGKGSTATLERIRVRTAGGEDLTRFLVTYAWWSFDDGGSNHMPFEDEAAATTHYRALLKDVY